MQFFEKKGLKSFDANPFDNGAKAALEKILLSLFLYSPFAALSDSLASLLLAGRLKPSCETTRTVA